MNITAIQTFLSVYRTGNLNRAASEMNVTQSTVTARLDVLEAQLGAALLIRSRRGAELTKAGFAFLEQAELISRSWDTARARLSLPQGVTGLCSLVCAPGLWAGVADAWISDLRQTYPATAFEIWTGRSNDAARWLRSGMSDAAILDEPLTGPDISSRPFARDTLHQVATVPRGMMDWDPSYVMVDYGPAFRLQHTSIWPDDNTAGMRFDTPGRALEHLLAYGGSAYLPEAIIAALIKSGTLYSVQNAPEFTRQSHLSWRKSSLAPFPWLDG